MCKPQQTLVSILISMSWWPLCVLSHKLGFWPRTWQWLLWYICQGWRGRRCQICHPVIHTISEYTFVYLKYRLLEFKTRSILLVILTQKMTVAPAVRWWGQQIRRCVVCHQNSPNHPPHQCTYLCLLKNTKFRKLLGWLDNWCLQDTYVFYGPLYRNQQFPRFLVTLCNSVWMMKWITRWIARWNYLWHYFVIKVVWYSCATYKLQM